MQIYKYRFLKRIIAFLRDKHEERSIIARYASRGWCDSTERALSNELMRRHTFECERRSPIRAPAYDPRRPRMDAGNTLCHA